ncbi:DUF2182 domain-containing protein [Marinobacter mobilis]|uniref:Predicted metal-binding membrane protein n=1 Tax=Marinobacter mobilis TaxID=488533 RepID=A0A1H2WQ23_9GAMM|nr:DUF2182 domain-containing protein [Marinobacter mobilis]SDW82655.1 Predicted metal-binding membrane protein [Marinobacter mobilis]
MTTNADARTFRLSGDAITTLLALAVVVSLCWWYLIELATDMAAMPMADMMTFRPWTASYFLMMFLMWAVMMVAMMVPSAIPMILLYRQVARHSRVPHPALGTALFVVAYVAVWTLFSLAATTLQWQLEQAALLSPMMASNSVVFSAAILILAGVYQWSPWKDACLRHCHGPFTFVMQHWRPGLRGALTMGLHHGAYCLGCCLLLMALLFVGGVMNLTVIALIAVLVLLEKVLPWGRSPSRLLGAIAIAAGLALLVWPQG